MTIKAFLSSKVARTTIIIVALILGATGGISIDIEDIIAGGTDLMGVKGIVSKAYAERYAEETRIPLLFYSYYGYPLQLEIQIIDADRVYRLVEVERLSVVVHGDRIVSREVPQKWIFESMTVMQAGPDGVKSIEKNIIRQTTDIRIADARHFTVSIQGLLVKMNGDKEKFAGETKCGVARVTRVVPIWLRLWVEKYWKT